MSIAKKFKGLSALTCLLCAGASLLATENDPTAEGNDKEILGIYLTQGFFQSFSDKLDFNNEAVRFDKDIVDENGDILGLVMLNSKIHPCVISGSKARLLYRIADEEERLLVLTFDEKEITEVHTVPEGGSFEDESTWEPQTDSAFLKCTPPIHYHQSVASTLGFPGTTFETDENGHIVTKVTTLTDLILANQNQMGTQLSDNHRELMEKIGGAESNLTATIKESIEESNKHNNVATIIETKMNKLDSNIEHMFSNYIDHEHFSTAKQVEVVNTNLKAAQEGFQNFQQNIFGINVDAEGNAVNGDLLTQLSSLIKGMANNFGITDQFIRSVDSFTQLLSQQDQLPLYYSGSIEHMLFGSARILKTDESKRSLGSMLLKFPEFCDLTGLNPHRETLLTIASQVEQIVGFLRGTDLPTFNYALPYLMGLFGPKFPVYDIAEKNISKYCEEAEFSLDDYGLYAWFHSLYSCLKKLSDAYEANHGESMMTCLAEANTELNRLYSGLVFDGKSEQKALPENFLGQNFDTYLKVLSDCLERLGKLKELVPSMALKAQLTAFQDETRKTLASLAAQGSETNTLLKQLLSGCGVVIRYSK